MKLKKLVRCLSCLVLAAVILFSAVPATAATFSSVPKNYEYHYGLDVSKWNGTLNWTKIKDSDVEFMYIRIGWYDDDGGHLDEKFKENVKKCVENGIEFGVYVYSYVYKYADNTACAKWIDRQLQALGNYCRDKDTIQVAYDIEDSVQIKALKKKKITKSYLQKSVMKFCDTVKDKGYIPVVYSFSSFFEDYLNITNFQDNGVKIWYAQWPAKKDLNTKVKKKLPNGTYADVWQFASTYKIGKTVFDTNVCYEDFYDYKNEDSSLTVKGLKNSYPLTGASVVPSVRVYDGSKLLKMGEDYKLAYFRNTRSGKGKLKIIRYKNGSYQETKTVTFTVDAKKVTGIKTKSGSDYIDISWNKSPGAVKYQIFEYDDDYKVYNQIDTVKTNSYTDLFLTQGTRYKLRIRPVSRVNGKNSYGAYTDFTAYTKYKKVAIKRVASAGKKTAAVTWTPKSENCRGYVVEYSRDKSFKTYSSKRLSDPDISTAKIKTKKSGVKYYFRVKSYNTVSGKTVYSVYSKILSAKIK